MLPLSEVPHCLSGELPNRAHQSARFAWYVEAAAGLDTTAQLLYLLFNYNVKLFIEQEDESDVTAPKGRKTRL